MLENDGDGGGLVNGDFPLSLQLLDTQEEVLPVSASALQEFLQKGHPIKEQGI